MKSFLGTFFLVLLINPLIAQINLSIGLVAHYPFNGNANDVSGNNYNGTILNGVTLANDRFGNSNSAYMFDGIDDYIRVIDNGAFSNATFGLSMWFKTTSSQLQNIVGKRNFTVNAGTGGAQYQFSINYAPFPGFLSNLVGNNSNCSSIPNSSYINTGETLCTSKWYHAVVTFDGSIHKLFLDGKLVNSSITSFTGMLTGCNSEIRFGNWWQQDLIPFQGYLDDIRWYNRALNQAEIDSLFNKFVSTESTIAADAGPDFSVCNNAPFTLNVNAPGAVQYAWTPKQFLNDSTLKSPTGTVTSTTKFYVTVKNASGCIGIDSILVTPFSSALFSVSPPKNTCNGIQTQLSAGGGTEYLWSPAGLVNNATIASPTTNITSSQLFTVKIKNATCNDSVSLYTSVTVLPAPSLKLTKSNDVDCGILQTRLGVVSNNAISYLWSPASLLNNSTSATPIAKPSVTTTFYVLIKDMNGCTNNDSITVYFKNINKSSLLIPNAFTPNGDGLNDCFGVKYLGAAEEFTFFIYNRYGEKVFETNDPAKCWNGLYKSDKPEPGNYVYYIKAKTNCDMIEKKGNILLIK